VGWRQVNFASFQKPSETHEYKRFTSKTTSVHTLKRVRSGIAAQRKVTRDIGFTTLDHCENVGGGFAQWS
jgi:hypothetical protein